MSGTLSRRVRQIAAGGQTVRVPAFVHSLLLEGDESGYLLLEGDEGSDTLLLEGDEAQPAGNYTKRITQ
jgi:hypothetical protein